MIIIRSNNCFDAWCDVSHYIIGHPKGEDKNVLIEIQNPMDFKDLADWIKKYDSRRIDSDKGDIVRHVINTIFPYRLQSYFSNRQDFYQEYGMIYSKSTKKGWGTYFQRLISFGKGINPQFPNQLEAAITALKGGSPQKYFITFHLTASNVDSNVRPMGPPCWQYGELIINDNGAVDLVAVYRNHDYFNKALGNFIGLAKLLEFVCKESGKTPGRLTVHSIHAFSSKGIRKLAALLTP